MSYRRSRYVPGGPHYHGIKLLRPYGKYPRKRALAMARAVDHVANQRLKEPRLVVQYGGATPYKIAKAPYYDPKKNRFFAKVLTNSGARLVTCTKIDNGGVVWKFATRWNGDYEARLPRGWFL